MASNAVEVSIRVNALNRLAGHSLIYGLAGMAASLASFVLTPLYARYLGPAAYGQLETLMAMTQIVTILSALGAGSAALALIIQPKGEAPAVAGSALLVVGVSAACWLLAAWGLAPWLGGLLHLPVAWIQAVGLSGALTALGQVPPAIWRAKGQAWLLAGFSFAQVLAVLLANITLVAVYGLGTAGILTGQIAVQALATVLGLLLVRASLLTGVRALTVRQLVSIGLTHVANSLSTWTTQLSDRFLLAACAAGPALGCYTLGNKIAAVAQLALASPLALAWPSFLAQVGQDRDAARQFGRLVEWLLLYASGLYLILVLPAEGWVRLLGGAAYASAVPLVPILALATLIAALQPVLVSGFGLSMRFRAIPLVAAAAAALNIGLNLWCIPRFGPLGAAWTTLIAYSVSAVAGRAFSQRLWPLPVDWRVALQPVGWAGLLAVVGWSVIPDWPWRLALLPAYPLGAWFFRRFRSHPVAAAESAPMPQGQSAQPF